MSPDQQIREEKFNSASDEVKLLYSDPSSGEYLWNLFSTVANNNPDYTQYTKFAIVVGDVILGIHKKETLSQQLSYKVEGLTESQINVLVEGLEKFLSPIPGKVSEKPQPVQAPTPITPAKPLNAMPENANLNQAHSYGAFRGEGSDTNEDEPVHRSSQDDIIRQ